MIGIELGLNEKFELMNFLLTQIQMISLVLKQIIKLTPLLCLR